MRIFLAAMILFLAPSMALAAPDGTWEVIFVPEDKKVYIAPKDMPSTVISVDVWSLEDPQFQEGGGIPEECEGYGELVFGPTPPLPEYCAQYFE
jgi:hypothetical protein